MPTPAKPLFRQRFCRACRALFFICSYCDRGQVYCSETCRQPARRAQLRQANRRHQQTARARLAHSRRQHAYRLRRAHTRPHCQPAFPAEHANKVTDHSSQAPLRVPPSRRRRSLYLLMTGGTAQRGLIVCRFCDRRGQFLKND